MALTHFLALPNSFSHCRSLNWHACLYTHTHNCTHRDSKGWCGPLVTRAGCKCCKVAEGWSQSDRRRDCEWISAYMCSLWLSLIRAIKKILLPIYYLGIAVFLNHGIHLFMACQHVYKAALHKKSSVPCSCCHICKSLFPADHWRIWIWSFLRSWNC